MLLTYALVVVNGDDSGNGRVSSATLTLDGTQILGPSDFSQSVGLITRTVSLNSAGTLTVHVASAPGSSVTISITGLVSPDSQLAVATTLINPSGGSVTIPNVAQLFVPPGAASSSGSQIEISTINSPYMDFLAPTLDPSVTLLNLPKFRIKSSTPLALPVRLQVYIPGLANLLPAKYRNSLY